MKIINFLFLLFGFALTALANDTAGTTSAGGITFTSNPNIVLLREKLIVSPNEVNVLYLFENKSAQNITTQVFFPLPVYKPQSVYGEWNPQNNTVGTPSLNFSLWVNGQPVKYQTSYRALLDGKDITEKLQNAGIPTDPYLISPKVRIDDKKVPTWIEQARTAGLLNAEDKARWQQQIIFNWTQTFPANQAILIEHRYQPAAGKFYAALEPNQSLNDAMTNLTNNIRTVFGLNLDELVGNNTVKNWLVQRIQQEINQSTPKNNIYAFFYNVNYILTTGANWSGPIRNFTLKILKPDNGVVAYNNFYNPHTAEIVENSQNITLFIKNFKPAKDLTVLFVNTH